MYFVCIISSFIGSQNRMVPDLREGLHRFSSICFGDGPPVSCPVCLVIHSAKRRIRGHLMHQKSMFLSRIFCLALCAITAFHLPAVAQTVGATVSGTLSDARGGGV